MRRDFSPGDIPAVTGAEKKRPLIRCDSGKEHEIGA